MSFGMTSHATSKVLFCNKLIESERISPATDIIMTIKAKVFPLAFPKKFPKLDITLTKGQYGGHCPSYSLLSGSFDRVDDIVGNSFWLVKTCSHKTTKTSTTSFFLLLIRYFCMDSAALYLRIPTTEPIY